MKLYYVLFAIVLSVPSLGNAFLVGSGRQTASRIVPSVVVMHESAADGKKSTEEQEGNNSQPAVPSSNGNENSVIIAEADAIFDSIDTDKDGGISNEELRTHLEGIGYSTESIRSLFATLDKNADGVISREEMRFAFSNYDIIAMYKAFGVGNDVTDEVYSGAIDTIRSDANVDPQASSPAMLNKLADLIFDMIDTDKSGEIDAAELKEHFLVTKPLRDVGDSSDTSVESILKALDINSDGVISREEMRSGFNQFDPKSLSTALGLRSSRTSEV